MISQLPIGRLTFIILDIISVARGLPISCVELNLSHCGYQTFEVQSAFSARIWAILDLSPVNSFLVLTGQFSGCSFQAPWTWTSSAPTLSRLLRSSLARS